METTHLFSALYDAHSFYRQEWYNLFTDTGEADIHRTFYANRARFLQSLICATAIAKSIGT
ncbi:uncharacterized protein PHALS_04177 [Plasmopara halstedii]|uniref:Uncharacterized protein n=1 Tax=Plasmopara halstedii TaxID=4781 RepID=A0A0P1A8E0_PLAHL|nr:uncharacterized protein PHALS_04177 [Plasmopara halstedii]CEG36926.1 hypothetical protein PHALS_04177 [Plasmopara halstedii]|eukprot:XP_024573295.1 hypothetical protein PHALS_04177 [Plasmopara halstedii]